MTPVSRRLLSGARIGIVIGGDNSQGKAFVEYLLSSSEEWILKVSPAPSHSSPEDVVLPFLELPADLWGKDDQKWRAQEETIVNAFRGAFGVYVGVFPVLNQQKELCGSDFETDSEIEVRMAQRLGRCAQLSGVHHFVFSGKDVRSEPCVLSLQSSIPSVLYLRVDTLLEDFMSSLGTQQGGLEEGKEEEEKEEEWISLISSKDLGHLAAKSFIEPQNFGLPGKVKIDPVSTEVVSKRKLLQRLGCGSELNNREAISGLLPKATNSQRTGMTTNLHLHPTGDNPASRR